MLGQDIKQLMRAAIEALKANPALTATGGTKTPDEGNTREDRQATYDGASGGRGP